MTLTEQLINVNYLADLLWKTDAEMPLATSMGPECSTWRRLPPLPVLVPFGSSILQLSQFYRLFL
jgi:hypothetical protein